MTCPSSESLVPYALGAGDPTVAEHLATCSSCEAEIARMREAAEMLRGPVVRERATETPECLDELTIADFVEGRLSVTVRTPIVAHLLTCARCRSVVRATGRLLADERVVRELPGVKHGPAERRRRGWLIPLGVAAAAALAIVFWPRAGEDRARPVLRSPDAAATVGPALIMPRADVIRVDRFVWSSVPSADRYRVRLYDSEGAVVWTAETADTVVELPDSVPLVPRAAYFWKIEAQTEWQRWVASDLVEFRLGPSPR